jgi:hypothetical protein
MLKVFPVKEHLIPFLRMPAGMQLLPESDSAERVQRRASFCPNGSSQRRFPSITRCAPHRPFDNYGAMESGL